MKNLIYILFTLLLFSSCAKQSFQDDPVEVYNEFWTHVDENYIYFKEKNVNWDSVYNVHGSILNTLSSEEDLLNAIRNSILELKDAHNALKLPEGFTGVYDYKQGYDIHFSLDLILEKYLDNNFKRESIFYYSRINKKTLYFYIPDVQNLNTLRALIRREITSDIENVIIDIRNNGGGDSNPFPDLLGDFVNEKTYLGAYIEKTGPGHDDVSSRLPVYAEANEAVNHNVEVYMLINRYGYSAASYMASMAKGLDGFTLVGQITGGGGGGNTGFELSNGWIVNVSVSDYVDKDGITIENGVTPDIKIENTAQDIASGNDIMLEHVLQMCK